MWCGACAIPCRPVEHRVLDLQCPENARPTGENHFDSSSTMQTFLEVDCGLSEEQALSFLGQIDFSREAVFVAAQERTITDSCIRDRNVIDTQICDDGLRVFFEDVLQDIATQGCPSSHWAVAVVMPREEMRAVLSVTAP